MNHVTVAFADRRGKRAEIPVTDPAFLMPEPGREAEWLQNCLKRVQAGYVHTVYDHTFVASWVLVKSGLAMLVLGRENGFDFRIETGRPADLPTLKFLFNKAIQASSEYAALQ